MKGFFADIFCGKRPVYPPKKGKIFLDFAMLVNYNRQAYK